MFQRRVFASCLPPLLATAVAPAALADFGKSDPGLALPVHCIEIAAASGAIGTPIALHFDRDGRLDVLVPVGGQLFFVSGPDPQQFSASLDLSGVTAFTAVERPNSWIEEAVAATADGLRFVHRDLENESSFSVITTKQGTAAWARARSLAAVDLDDDGDIDIVGLSSHGRSLLKLERTGPGTWSELPVQPLPVELVSLEPLSWGTGQAAFVGVNVDSGNTDDALVVVHSDGSLVALLTPGGRIDDVVVMAGRSIGTDSIAARIGDEIRVVRAGGAMEPAVDLSHISPTGMSSTDVDLDGMGDLLVNATVLDRTTVLFGSPSGPLNPGSALLVSWDTPTVDMGVQTVAPIGGDFDRDGDIDIFQMFDDTRAGLLKRSTGTDETSFHPIVRDSYWTIAPTNRGLSTVEFTVEVPPLQSGSVPDVLEVNLSASSVGSSPGSLEHARVAKLIDLDGHEVGDEVTFTVAFRGDIGPNASVTARGLGIDAASRSADEVGVERAFRYTVLSAALRGTNNGADPTLGENNGDVVVPPPPPEPINPFE